jgi:hypothetical protein
VGWNVCFAGTMGRELNSRGLNKRVMPCWPFGDGISGGFIRDRERRTDGFPVSRGYLVYYLGGLGG